MLSDPGKPSLCLQVGTVLGLLSRPREGRTWAPQVRVEKKVFGGWVLVGWL